MAADGLIVLGLDVSQTQANIQTELNSILNNTKTKKIILQTAIEKTQTEQEVNAVVTQLNKKTVKLGVEINAKDVNGILAAQQKIASTQARLNKQMQEYRNTAREIGVTLNKNTWNAFNHAISSGDFTKANEILKSAKKQIEEYNAAVKKMNSDTSVTGSVSSLIDQFSKLQNVSSETQSRVNLLRANLVQFEKAGNVSAKLSAYNRLKTMLESLSVEYQTLKTAETKAMSDSSIQNQIKNTETYVRNLKMTYASLGNSESAQNLKISIQELETTLNSMDRSATGGKLQAQWLKVAEAINNAKRAVSEYKTEQTAVGSMESQFSGIFDKIQNTLTNVTNSGIKGAGITELTSTLTGLQSRALTLQTALNNLDPSNAEDVKRLRTEIEQLGIDFSKLKDNASSFKDPISAQQLATNIEKAKQKVADYANQYSAIKSRPELVTELTRLQEQANNLSTNADLKKFNADFEQFNTKVKQAGLHTQSLGDKLKVAFKNFASFFSASRLMYSAFNELKQMVNHVKELDASMVNLRKVTDETDASYDRFLTNAKSKAVELGTTVKDLVDATTNFSRLGFSLQEAESLGQIATIYANVGDLNSIDEATNSLISTMKGFGIESEDALTTLDKFNEVGNNFAISSGDIGEALQRSASSMAAANNTIDETIALITAANTVVQDATSVGTAFKTISMRIRGATTEMEQAGLDMDGMASSTAKLREEIKALSGVDIMLDETTFKSTYQIIEELAAKWQNLTDIQQASVTELIAGKRQGNIISAVMENFDIAENALKSSLGSAGSAMEEYNTYLEGIEAKTNQFKAAFEALSTTVFESDFLKGIIEFGTQAITVLDNVIQSLGGMGNSLMMLVSIIALFHPAKTLATIKTIFTAIGNFTGITKLAAGIKALSIGWQEAKAAGLSFSQFLGNLKGQLLGTASAATIATAAITAIVAVITIAIAIYQNWKRKQEEIRQSLIEEGNTAAGNSQKIAELTATYLEMCDAVDNGTASTEDLTNAQNEVISALELTGRSVRELTDEYGSLKDAIIAASQSQLKTNASAAIAGANAAKEQVEEDLKTGWFGGNSKYFSSIGEEANEIMSYLKELGYDGIDNTGSKGGGTIFLPSVYTTGGDTSKATFEDLMADYKYLEEMMNDIRSEFGTDNDLFDQVSEMYSIYSEHLGSAIESINQANTAIAQELIFAAQTDDVPETVEEYKQVREELISDLENNADWNENGTYSAEGLIDSLLAENAAFQDIAKMVTEEEATAAEIKEKRDSIAEVLVPKNYEDLQAGTAAHFHAIDEYGIKLSEVKEKLKTLSDEDLNIAYDLMEVPDNGIQSWDDLVQAIDDYKNNISDIIPYHNQVRTSLESLWNSENFKDTKDAIVEMAKTLDGITADGIEELASESEELAEILETDGMNAEFLAHVLQTVADGKDGFALITDDALKLNDALEGMVTAFDDVTDAKARYDAALSGGEKDDNFKSYAEAFETLNAEFEAGTTNSNAFWAAAEFMFGSEQLALWGWADGLDEIYAAMQKNAGVFSDAESAGLGFLDRLYELSEAGKLVNEEGEKLIEISKNADGSYTFDMDYENLDLIAEKMGLTREATLACWEALSMWGEVNFADMAEVISVIEEIGLAVETAGGKAINLTALTDQLISLGKTDKDIATIIGNLQNLDGVVLLNAETTVDNFTQSLVDLGLAADDGVTVSVDVTELGSLLSELNFTKGQAEEVITKLQEADGITLTNAGESVDSVQSALDTLSQFDFATVESDVGTVEGAVSDVDDSTTDNVVSEINDIGTAADNAVTRIDNIVSAMTRVDGTTATVTINEKRRSGLLGILGFAKGTDNAPDGAALVGEDGEELIKSGDQAYLAGTNGPEIVNLDQGDTVYTAEETKQIKRSGKSLSGVIPAYSGGYDGGASGTIGKKKWKSVIEAAGTVKVNDVELDSDSLEESLEDTLKEMDDEINKILAAYEHQIFLLDKNNGDPAEIIAIYKKMQDAVHEQANEYRSMGLGEDSEYIMELQKQWWDYQDSIKDVMTSVYEDIVSQHENAISLTENWLQEAIDSGNATDISKYTGDIVQHYRDMQDTVHEQAEYYRSLGYDETSDEISQLSDLWWDYYDEIKNVSAEAWQQVVDNANDALDSIQRMYDSLKSAAQEYAETGSITVDTLQDILSYGVENLAYLRDENGLLVINEESIQKVIAARTQQMAIESALNYIQQLRTALTNNDTIALLNLTTATGAAASSTWDLVYAQLQLLGLSSEQYNNALQRINVMRSLADSAVTSIGRIDTSAKEALEETSTALDDLLKYVMDMIKQEVENQITALEDQVDRYRDIVDLQKESLELEREKDKYTKDVAEKTQSIAELRARITRLDLDDSREAQAEKKKLQEQLAEEQADLADTQADHAYDATNDMLDDMFEAYEKEKQEEIAVLEDSISSTEKLYQLAIDRINNHWDTLYNDLINWNYQYGNTVQSELISAWNNASTAVQQYGSYLNAVAATQAQIASFKAGSFNTVGDMGNYDTSGGETMNEVRRIVAQMKANSKQHGNEDAAGQLRLNKENLRLGAELENLIGRTVVRGDDGVWYLDKVGGKQLYSTYPYSTYHTGGIVGDQPTKQQDEMFALLEKSEAVFTEPQQKQIYRVLDTSETIAAKLGIGGLYRSMNGSGYAETQTQKAVMRDMQQAQSAAGSSQTIQSVGDVTVPVHVMVTEKLDKSDIRRLRKEISSVASEGLAEAFIKRGKGTLRDSLLKP